VGKWESCFWISTFPRHTSSSASARPLNANQTVVGAVEMWESRRLCEISKAAWKRWEACRSLSIVSTRRHFHNARFMPETYTISAWGTRSPSRIAKRCNAAFQFCTGIVHFLAICSKARYSSFKAAS
jgi:hypothetical protein